MTSASDQSLGFMYDFEKMLSRVGHHSSKVGDLLRGLIVPTLHRPGDAVRAYEQAYEAMFPGSRAFAFWKGRVALYAILRGLGIGPGDDVLMPGYTCMVVPGAAIYAGARPIYIDIRPEDYNLDPDLLDRAVTPNTRALIVQHTYGYPADMDRIMAWAKQRQIPVIEDCCHALGCLYRGKLVGRFGAAAFFSSQWNKHFPTALGGVAIVNDTGLAGQIEHIAAQECCTPTRRAVWMLGLQMLAHHGLVFPRTLLRAQGVFRWLTAKGLVIGSASSEELTDRMPPNYFMGMSDLQARVGLYELTRLLENLRHRADVSNYYRRRLRADANDEATQPLVRYPLRVKDRDAFIAAAFRERIEIGTWFEAPLHPHETDHTLFGYQYGSCPEAERAASHVVNLPVHLRVSHDYAECVVDFVNRHADQLIDSERTALPADKTDERQREEIAEIAASWYVPPSPRVKTGWLVYSLDFVLATLQGAVYEQKEVRRTPGWLVFGHIVRVLMAVAQAIIMLLAWLPIVSWFLETLVRTFTRNSAGFFLRSCYWKAKLKHLGVDTLIDQGVEIWGPANVSIGSHCHIDTHVRLAAGERRHGQRGSITIGSFVHLGPGAHIAGRGGVQIRDFVGIMANAHLYSATGIVEKPSDPGQLISMSHMAPRDQQHIVEEPILIDRYAFIGMMTRIMPGVKVGFGAVVHGNCELTRDIPPFANIGGVPRGRQIGWRKPRRHSPRLSKEDKTASPTRSMIVPPKQPAPQSDSAGDAPPHG